MAEMLGRDEPPINRKRMQRLMRRTGPAPRSSA
jgi:hypothetical protein